MGMAVAGVQGAEKQFGVRHFAQGHFDMQTRGIKPVTWATAAGVEPGARKCLTFVLEKWLTRLIDHQNSLQLVSFWLTNWSTDWLTCCCNAAVNAELRRGTTKLKQWKQGVRGTFYSMSIYLVIEIFQFGPMRVKKADVALNWASFIKNVTVCHWCKMKPKKKKPSTFYCWPSLNNINVSNSKACSIILTQLRDVNCCAPPSSVVFYWFRLLIVPSESFHLLWVTLLWFI